MWRFRCVAASCRALSSCSLISFILVSMSVFSTSMAAAISSVWCRARRSSTSRSVMWFGNFIFGTNNCVTFLPSVPSPDAVVATSSTRAAMVGSACQIMCSSQMEPVLEKKVLKSCRKKLSWVSQGECTPSSRTHTRPISRPWRTMVLYPFPVKFLSPYPVTPFTATTFATLSTGPKYWSLVPMMFSVGTSSWPPMSPASRSGVK
mmetsp:Transcript_85536/g.205003  ORF Transcript_85536/g.205003 Transcript_85536/m.205003 type:complete len:205 (-) Transcript_85536:970-1584(-)